MKEMTTEQLRQMEGQEGLVIQGCGGDLQEWVDGINGLLTEAQILCGGSKFQSEDVAVFRHDGLTNLYFPFEGAELKMGRLAMWRLQTHEQFGGTWLSDYVPNRLGGFLPTQQERPNPPAGHQHRPNDQRVHEADRTGAGAEGHRPGRRLQAAG